MRENCSNICKLCPCLVTESANWARMCTILTTVLQRQYLQTELIFWITLVYLPEAQQGCLGVLYPVQYSIDLTPCEFHVFPRLKEHLIHHFLPDCEVICDST